MSPRHGASTKEMDTVCSCEYIKETVADSRQWVVFKLEGWVLEQQRLTLKKPACYQMLPGALDLSNFFGTT